jgi:hypothetical protein
MTATEKPAHFGAVEFGPEVPLSVVTRDSRVLQRAIATRLQPRYFASSPERLRLTHFGSPKSGL